MSQIFKKLIPTFNRILVKKFEISKTTASGILLNHNPDEKNQIGEVVQVGPGNLDNNGNKIPLEVQVGDFVLLPGYEGTEIKFDQDKFYVFRDTDIIGKLEK